MGVSHKVEAALIRPEGANVAVSMIQTLPDGVPIAMLGAITAKMDAQANSPWRLMHTHYEEDGRVRIMDVWESSGGQRLCPLASYCRWSPPERKSQIVDQR